MYVTEQCMYLPSCSLADTVGRAGFGQPCGLIVTHFGVPYRHKHNITIRTGSAVHICRQHHSHCVWIRFKGFFHQVALLYTSSASHQARHVRHMDVWIEDAAKALASVLAWRKVTTAYQ